MANYKPDYLEELLSLPTVYGLLTTKCMPTGSPDLLINCIKKDEFTLEEKTVLNLHLFLTLQDLKEYSDSYAGLKRDYQYCYCEIPNQNILRLLYLLLLYCEGLPTYLQVHKAGKYKIYKLQDVMARYNVFNDKVNTEEIKPQMNLLIKKCDFIAGSSKLSEKELKSLFGKQLKVYFTENSNVNDSFIFATEDPALNNGIYEILKKRYEKKSVKFAMTSFSSLILKAINEKKYLYLEFIDQTENEEWSSERIRESLEQLDSIKNNKQYVTKKSLTKTKSYLFLWQYLKDVLDQEGVR